MARQLPKPSLSVTRLLMQLLGVLMPPKSHEDIPVEVILHNAPRCQRIYARYTWVFLFILFGIPLFFWAISGHLESLLFVKRDDALFSFNIQHGVLGIAIGIMLSFAFALPITNWLIEGLVGKDFMAIYKAWYDQHPNHQLNSDAFARVLRWIFIPLAFVVAWYMRYDYTFVTQDQFIQGQWVTFSERSMPLSAITNLERRIHEKAKKEDHSDRFRYRVVFNQGEPWESYVFNGPYDPDHLRYRPMIDYLMEKTKLELESR